MKFAELMGRNLFFHVFLNLAAFPALAQPIPVLCENEPMLIYSDTNKLSRLYRIKIDQANQDIQLIPFSEIAGQSVNGIGYRQQDQLIYGSEGGDVLQMDATGYGIPMATVDVGAYAGDITPDGKYLVYSTIESIISINLASGLFEKTERPYIFKKPAKTLISLDIAFNPSTGILYGFDAVGKNLVTINPQTGWVDNTRFAPAPIENGIPAMFFDSYGNLWGFSNHIFYQISTVNGQPQDSIPLAIKTGGRLDGCSCPGSFNFQKSAWPDTVSRCGTLEYYFAVSNRSGQTQTQVELDDEMPAGMVIEAIVDNPFGGQVSGIGSNRLSATGWNIPEGIDTLVVRVRLNQLPPGTYYNQASIRNIKIHSATAIQLLSDNPATHAISDSTAVFVKELPTIYPDAGHNYICPGDELLLACGLPGFKQYAWNTGDTTSQISVSQPGEYTLYLDSGCETTVWQYTVHDAAVQLELGVDQSIFSGDTLPLPVQISSLGKIINSKWTSEPSDVSVECRDCVNTRVFPVDDTRYSLFVENEFGCTASDALLVDVERPYYVANVFCPTSPSPNNVFFIQSKNPIDISHIEVYDRWGELVYQRKNIQTNDIKAGWDGTANGSLLRPGVYIWTAALQHANGATEKISGDVTLLE